MAAALTDWQQLNLDTIAEALPAARIIRVTTRTGGAHPTIHIGQASALDHEGYRGTLTIRDLEHRHRHRFNLAGVTAVEIIGIYLKDYGG